VHKGPATFVYVKGTEGRANTDDNSTCIPAHEENVSNTSIASLPMPECGSEQRVQATLRLSVVETIGSSSMTAGNGAEASTINGELEALMQVPPMEHATTASSDKPHKLGRDKALFT
jgi:hypothetical protein